jgi:ABC-2 type transport system ATP-binding protein
MTITEAGRGPTLRVSGMTKRYGQRVVVDDLSFDVHPGRVTGFLGPNGSGKSTTMKVLLGLAACDHGYATVHGAPYRNLRDPIRTVGVVLEPNAFHPGRSGRNHLRILADAASIPLARVDEVVALVELADAADRHVGTYSLGMRQRLSLAAALLGDPSVLVLDEPANGLDPQGIRTLRGLLRSRAAAGHTVFVSSHLLAEMEQLADELIVISQGRLVTSGSLIELRHAASLVRSAAPERLRLALAAAGALTEPYEEDSLLVRGLPLAAIGDAAFHAGIAVHELSTHTGSLEELFLDWTSGATPSPTPTADQEAVLS